MPLDESMTRIEEWFAREVTPDFFAPGLAGSGATYRSQEPLSEIHARWNGQTDAYPCFYEGFSLLSAEDAASEKTGMDTLAKVEAWDTSWWDPNWFPFATDLAGQLLVLDIERACVLEFIHDDDPRPELASSLELFFETFANDLASGKRALRGQAVVDVAEHEAMLERNAERTRRRAAKEQEFVDKNRRFLWTMFIVALLLGCVWLILR